MDGRALDELRALEDREAELAARLERLTRAGDEVAAIRTGAEATAAFYASYRDEETRRRAELASAEQGVREREGEVAAAEERASAARNEEERREAKRAATRAADHRSVAELRAEWARAGLADLEREARTLEQALPELEARAAATSRAEGLPAPGQGLQELVDWAAGARAELFVSAGQVSVQLERVVREGNELASMLLGDETYGLTVAQARRQVETRA